MSTVFPYTTLFRSKGPALTGVRWGGRWWPRYHGEAINRRLPSVAELRADGPPDRLTRRQPVRPPPGGRREDPPLTARFRVPGDRAAAGRQAGARPNQRARPGGAAARVERAAERPDRQ